MLPLAVWEVPTTFPESFKAIALLMAPRQGPHQSQMLKW